MSARKKPRKRPKLLAHVGGAAMDAVLKGMGERSIELAERRLELLRDEAKFQEHLIASTKFAMKVLDAKIAADRKERR